MSRAEQGWVQVAAGMSTRGHRKVTRARDESKTEDDGYGAGQDGDTRELLGRRELPASVRGSAQRSRVWGDGSGRGAGDWAGYGGWEDDYYNGNIGSKEFVGAVSCDIMIIIFGKARRTKARGRCN